jgi:hypothetical protein
MPEEHHFILGILPGEAKKERESDGFSREKILKEEGKI